MAERRQTRRTKPKGSTVAKAKPKTGKRGARNRTTNPAPRRPTKVGFMQRAARAAEIATMRAQDPPISWAAISKEVDLSESQCRVSYGEWLRWRETESSPERVVDETVALMTGLIATMAVIVDEADAPHNARVGAGRALMDAVNARYGLLVRAGRVPQRLHAFRGGLEVDEAWRQWIELLERYVEGGAVSRDVVAEFAALRRRLNGGGAQATIEGHEAA
jgi:hypothetical protein